MTFAHFEGQWRVYFPLLSACKVNPCLWAAAYQTFQENLLPCLCWLSQLHTLFFTAWLLSGVVPHWPICQAPDSSSLRNLFTNSSPVMLPLIAICFYHPTLSTATPPPAVKLWCQSKLTENTSAKLLNTGTKESRVVKPVPDYKSWYKRMTVRTETWLRRYITKAGTLLPFYV